MTKYRAGDVVLVRFPFTDMTSAKVRPAVVISTKKQDVIVIGVFSRVPQVIEDTWVLLNALVHYFPDTGLKKTSVAKAEKIAVIDKKIIRRRIGTLPPEMMAQVKMAVKRALKSDWGFRQIIHRAIATLLIKQAGLQRTEAGTGAVTLRKPIGSAANLNIHLHCLVLDGVYSAHRGRTGVPRRARPHRRRAAGLTQPDHKTHRAVIDP